MEKHNYRRERESEIQIENRETLRFGEKPLAFKFRKYWNAREFQFISYLLGGLNEMGF